MTCALQRNNAGLRRWAHFHERQSRAPEAISPEAIAAEFGEWARGYALGQCLSGEKARRELDWQPRHLDPLRDIAELVRIIASQA